MGNKRDDATLAVVQADDTSLDSCIQQGTDAVRKHDESITTGLQASAPIFEGHYQPSAATLADSKPITWREVKRGIRHLGCVIYFVVDSILTSEGTTLSVRDSNDERGKVWSLVNHPLPGCKASQYAHLVVAVKEPNFDVAVDGTPIVCVHHPTDIVRIPLFEATAKKLFASISQPEDDLIKAGSNAFAAGQLWAAVDYYSGAIRQVNTTNHADPATPAKLRSLVLKRAFTYTRLQMHSLALKDSQDVLATTPTDQQALKLACASALEIGDLGEARLYAVKLLIIAPGTASEELIERAADRVQQAAGSYDLGLLAVRTTMENPITDFGSFVGDIEVRKSSLAGLGTFATKRLSQGQLLLCEKPLVSSSVRNQPSCQSTPKGLDPVKRFNRSVKMDLFQHLASKAVGDPALMSANLDFTDGTVENPPGGSTKVFNSYSAFKVLNYMHWAVEAGQPSQHHDGYDPTIDGEFDGSFDPSNMLSGLWYRISLFNHSCLPNTHRTYIGDLTVVQALRDIEIGEELTLCYLDFVSPCEQRKRAFALHGFECSCPLCKADATLDDSAKHSREFCQWTENDSTGLRKRCSGRAEVIACYESIVRECMQTYDPEIYQGIPYVETARLLFQLGHTYLGAIAEWAKVSLQTRSKAHDCFLATMEVGLGIKVVMDASSSYCELVFPMHSQVHPVGILALVGLAELAFLSKDTVEWKRFASLLTCAKQLYKLNYGENATFGDHHRRYRCMAGMMAASTSSPPSGWAKVKAAAVAKPSAIPKFLS